MTVKRVTEAQRVKMRTRLAATKVKDEVFLNEVAKRRAKRERDRMESQRARLKAYENWLRDNNNLKEVAVDESS